MPNIDAVIHRIRHQQGGFLTSDDVKALVELDRLHLVLVRCGCGRFLCPVQDLEHFTTIIREHREKVGPTSPTGDYVRDVSLPARL
jgi:hypothetical protein